MVALFGVLLASLPGGPPLWPFLVGAVAGLGFFWLFARTLWRGVRPRYATGMSLEVDRQELRRGDRVGAAAEGEGELEVGLVCTQSFDVWRRISDDSPSRVTNSASVWQQWVPRPTARWVSASSSRCRPTARTPTRATASRSAGRSSCDASARSASRSPCRVGGAVRLRVEVDGEPLAPGAAVSGRVVVEDGGRARSLSVRLAFVERTADFDTVARDAGTQVARRGRPGRRDRRRVPAAPPRRRRCRRSTPPTRRIGWEVRARVDRAGPDPTADQPVELLQGYTAPDRERWPSG